MVCQDHMLVGILFSSVRLNAGLWNEKSGSGFEGLNSDFVLPRKHLVESIFKLLSEAGFAFLQGPPYGGKTTMLQLVLNYAKGKKFRTHYINVSAGTRDVDSFVEQQLGANLFELMNGECLSSVTGF